MLVDEIHAQSGHASWKDAKFIKQNELVVLLDSQETAYNVLIKSVIEKYWKFSSFKFVSQKEKELYCKKGKVVLTHWRMYESTNKLHYFSIFFPGDDDCDWRLKELRAYAYVSFDPDKLEGHLIRGVQFIQNYLQTVLEKKMGRNGLYEICDFCNTEKKSIHNKTLLINNSEIEDKLNDSAKVAKYYKHPFKLVGREDICRIIPEQSEDLAYLFNFADIHGAAFKLVVQVKDSKIIYCNKILVEQYDFFNKQDLQELSR